MRDYRRGNDGSNRVGKKKEVAIEELLPIYTLDIETDPFKHGRFPVPFVVGFFDGKEFRSFWGSDCIEKSVEYIKRQPPGIIYAHNGGRFDFFYYIEHMAGDMRIINSRIVEASLYQHIVRDSFAIMPFPLKAYKKDDIDYTWLERGVRRQHRKEIIEYLYGDCFYLWELCIAFREMFGDRLTIGSTSMAELKKIHKFQPMSNFYDEKIRQKFFYGGRVQCFKKGVINQNIKIYDVNSMYPFVMRDYDHPLGLPSSSSKYVTDKTCFVIAEGKNYGAFPTKVKNGISFERTNGIFSVSIHEWNVALELDLFRPTRIINCVNFDRRGKFDTFVNHFYEARRKAKIDKDETKILFYKFVLNSAYGKFAQNPKNYFDFTMLSADNPNVGADWTPSFINGKYIIWKRPAEASLFSRHNVATASSITGAARSILLRAIATSKNPLYCDTDSLICEDIGPETKIDDTELGAWKFEKAGTWAAIAGKKMYAIYSGAECVKMATKGVKLKPDEITRVARGEKIVAQNIAPTFKWDGSHSFIHREVKLT